MASAAGHTDAPVVPDALEQVKGLPKPVLVGVLTEHHVVAAAGRHKDDGRYVVEALNPLAPLVPLASHVKHAARGALHHHHFPAQWQQSLSMACEYPTLHYLKMGSGNTLWLCIFLVATC